MKKGLFITFEGPDGAGKTTVCQGVYKKMQAEGYDVMMTREPGGIDIAEQIRKVILDPANSAMDKKTEALLYAASRRQHLVEKVIPALEAGKIVLCDRFVDSSLAYQGVARQIGIEEVLQVNQFAIEGHFPDKTIYLDLDAETGIERIQNRQFLDRLDQEEIGFHYAVVEGYQLVREQFQDRMITVDASKSEIEVIEAAYMAVKGYVSSVV